MMARPEPRTDRRYGEMRLADHAAAYPNHCRVCTLNQPGVDFDIEDGGGWLFICATCLGKAAALLGGGVPKDEYDRVVAGLNAANHALTQTTGERESVAAELAQLKPEVGRLHDQVDELVQTRVALQQTIAGQAEQIRAYQHGRVMPPDEQAKTAFAAAARTPEPPAATPGRKRKAT